MKLCITAAGNTLSAPTDSAFGRAPWFMLVDTDSGAAEALANSSADAVQGAGIAAAQLMAEHKVEAVLTGRLGPKAQAALAAAGIAMHEGLGRCTVGEALAQFRAGQYSAAGAGSAAGAAVSAASAGQGPGRGMGGGRGQDCGKCGGGRGRR
ncbi:MAG: NifB/NifX family molybdenum-iron cluster-binding protein [Candidatus Electronema sp. VV]